MDISALNAHREDVRTLQVVPAQVEADTTLRLPRAPSQGLAMSLERRRLQFYLVLVLADMGILLGSFALAGALYPLVLVNHDTMLPAYLMLPLFQTIAFYNSTYSREGLTRWRASAWHAILALLVSALMFNFFAFFVKANAEFSRALFVGGLVAAGIGMTLIRWLLARFIVAQWGPSAINRLLIEAGGPPVAIPNLYRVNARDHGLRPDLEDPLALDRLSKYLRNMDMVIVSCGQEDRLAWSEVLRGSGIHGEVISEFAQEIGALAIVHHEEASVTALVVSRGHLGLRARISKRVFDLVASILAMIVLLPVLLACAAATSFSISTNSAQCAPIVPMRQATARPQRTMTALPGLAGSCARPALMNCPS